MLLFPVLAFFGFLAGIPNHDGDPYGTVTLLWFLPWGPLLVLMSFPNSLIVSLRKRKRVMKVDKVRVLEAQNRRLEADVFKLDRELEKLGVITKD